MNTQAITATTLFLIEPDYAVLPLFRQNLRDWGYQVVVALDAEDALQRTQCSSEAFDLILLNQVRQPLDHLIAFGRQLRQQAKLPPSVPIVVLAETYDAALEGQNVPVGDSAYVAYLEDGEQLKTLLHKLCPV